MVAQLAIGVGVPLAFWTFDLLGKTLGSIDLEDMGADLCLLGFSLSLTTLPTSLLSAGLKGEEVTQNLIGVLVATMASAILISLLAYVIALIIIAPGGNPSYPRIIQTLRSKPPGVKLKVTVIIGFFVVIIQTVMLVSFLLPK